MNAYVRFLRGIIKPFFLLYQCTFGKCVYPCLRAKQGLSGCSVIWIHFRNLNHWTKSKKKHIPNINPSPVYPMCWINKNGHFPDSAPRLAQSIFLHDKLCHLRLVKMHFSFKLWPLQSYPWSAVLRAHGTIMWLNLTYYPKPNHHNPQSPKNLHYNIYKQSFPQQWR